MNEEKILKKLRGKIVVGIDEVGRGSWAGPLVVGAVILNEEIAGVADSKVVSKRRRSEVAKLIRQSCLACSTGWVSSSEVDELGLTKATELAIKRAIEDIKDYDYIVVDGSINYIKDNSKSFNLIRADSLIDAVSAASIIAKVARDEYMEEQAMFFPGYGFDSHVGYGTVAHRRAIIDHGVTPLHRKSYKPIQAMIGGSV